MAQIFDIREVTVGPRNFDAVVVLAPDAPLTTDEDPQGTALVRDLLPGLQDHVCLGDSSEKFGEVMDQTELAHLLEHVTVELLALTDIAGDVSTGRTAPVEGEERAYDITLACPDDVLVASALSSAVWILQWAYTGGGEPVPDVDAIVSGIVGLVQSLPEPEPMPQPEPEVVETVEPPVEESAEACADEPADVAAGATAPMPEPQVVAYEPAAAAAPAAESASAAEPEPVDPDATVFSPMMAQMVADQLGAQDLDEPEPVAPGAAPEPEPEPAPAPAAPAPEEQVERLVAEVHAAADVAPEPAADDKPGAAEAQPETSEPAAEDAGAVYGPIRQRFETAYRALRPFFREASEEP